MSLRLVAGWHSAVLLAFRLLTELEDEMARDYIKIDLSNQNVNVHAQTLRSFVSALRQAYEQGKHIQALMGHMHDGAVFTDIELNFGLPAGKGQFVFDLVNGTIGAMEGGMQNAQAVNLTEMVGAR